LSFGWFKRLLQDPQFGNRVNCRWKSLRSTILAEDKLFQYIDSVELALERPQQRHFVKFPVLGIVNGAPEIGTPAATFHDEILNLKAWIHTRMVWLDANMVGDCDLITGLSLNMEPRIRVHPNPASSFLIVTNDGERQPYTIVTTLGAIVNSGVLEEGENVIQINVASGFYLLRSSGEWLKVLIQN
jgi:hypothetical protein